MRVLVAINQLSVFAGGSILPLEVAEHLATAGHECIIAANVAADPLKGIAQASGIMVTEDLPSLNAFDYDLVWSQNQTAPLLGYRLEPGSRDRTLFVFAHLSTQTALEVPGLVLEPLIADVVLANSAETRHHLVTLGLDREAVDVFPNPAPESFWAVRSDAVERRLKTVLLVSNHPPPEAMAALAILEASGVRVRLVGRDGYSARVTPYLLERTNAVITIGKTVQYALACGKTPYVYDRYGGPGYMTRETFGPAAAANFSGRCCRRALEARTIAAEVMDGFADASTFVKTLPEEALAPYRLGPHLERILDRIPSAPPNAERMAAMVHHGPMLARERLLATAIRENFGGHVRANQTVRRLRRHIDALGTARNA